MITASICECNRTFLPKRTGCPYCGKDTKDIQISEEGEVLTYTTLYMTPEGFGAPLNIALVNLENNTKLLCESRCTNIKIGIKVHIKVEQDKYFCIEK